MKKTLSMLLVLLLIPVLYVATGAFTGMTAERTADITLAGDASALLGIAPYPGPNGAYVLDSDGDGAYELVLDAVMEGVNTNAITLISDVFTLTNNGTQAVTVSIESVGDYSGAVSFGDLEEGVPLPVGSQVPVSLSIDTRGLPAGTTVIESIIIRAGAGTDSPWVANAYAPVLSVIGDNIFDEANSSLFRGTQPATDGPAWSRTFNGRGDSVVIPNQAAFNPTRELTLETWVRWDIDPSTGAAWANIINKSEHQYQLQHSGYTSSTINQYFEFALETTSGRKFLFSTTTPQAGAWYHVVATYSAESERMSIYVNGVLEASRTQKGDIRASDADVYIGQHETNNRFFSGTVAEVAIYDRSLSDAEIVSLSDRYLALLAMGE